jgi:hypothetical protein
MDYKKQFSQAITYLDSILGFDEDFIFQGKETEIEQEIVEQQINEKITIKIDSSKKINIYAGTGENAELSNFAERPVTLGDQTFRTPEGAFQAMKIWFTNAVLLNTPASKENLKIVEQLKAELKS